MGAVIARVVAEPIAEQAVAAELAEPGHGCQLVFRGVVRDLNLGRAVRAVTYDAHAPMAERVFREIGEEARQRWGAGLGVAIVHRVGRLEVGEASVLIVVGAAHRDEGYQASRYAIEQLKRRAPIWKQEHYADGDSEWVKGHSLCEHAAGS